MYTVTYKKPIIKTENNRNHSIHQKQSNIPAANVEVLETGWKVMLMVPGYTREEVTISIEKELLHIKGNLQNQEMAFHKREWFYGTFERSFRLPENVNMEGIEAEMNQGILSVFIPKKEKTVSKIDIK